MWKGHFIFHSTLVLSHFSTFMECDFLTPLQTDTWVGSMDPLIDIINQYHAHGLSSFIALLISFVWYFEIVIHYFQFVNFTHLFQPSYSPLEDPAKLNVHCKPIGLPTKCSIELLVLWKSLIYSETIKSRHKPSQILYGEYELQAL